MMRWDFGAVYKEIRESKGLSQKEVVGDRISRQSLISFEKGDSTPRYETMDYLLRQIDMSFAEFEYICHYYHPFTINLYLIFIYFLKQLVYNTFSH